VVTQHIPHSITVVELKPAQPTGTQANRANAVPDFNTMLKMSTTFIALKSWKVASSIY